MEKAPFGFNLSKFLTFILEGDECLEWKGAKNSAGYGQFRGWSKTEYAHRFIYEALHGPIPDGMVICHHCDNPSCVRPSHLFLGTQSENLADAGRKGTMNRRGRNVTLTEDQVKEIRKKYAMGGTTYYKLSREYGVYLSTIQKIVKRETWTHV